MNCLFVSLLYFIYYILTNFNRLYVLIFFLIHFDFFFIYFILFYLVVTGAGGSPPGPLQ
jgi:hypothetical protein